MDLNLEFFKKDTFLMAFLLKTRWNLGHTSGSSNFGNNVDSTAEQSTSLAQSSQNNIEEDGDPSFRSQFSGAQTHFTADSPRRWNYNLDSGSSSFEPYVRSIHNQVPADSSTSQGLVESSDSQEAAESSGNQVFSADSTSTFLPESPSILVVDDDCELVPLQSHLGAVASRMSYFMRACRSCERSLQDKIDDLPKSKITPEHVDNGELCSVCMENFILDEEVNQLPCSHLFHIDCISPWLRKRQTCPICRKVAVTTGGRSKVKLHRFQAYNRRRQSSHLLPPQWRF